MYVNTTEFNLSVFYNMLSAFVGNLPPVACRAGAGQRRERGAAFLHVMQSLFTPCMYLESSLLFPFLVPAKQAT